MHKYLDSSARLVLTLWIGSMLTVGYLVAPILFQMLDKQLAGQVAGRLFHFVFIIGLVSGPLLALHFWRRSGKAALKNWRLWALVAMLVLVIIGFFVLQPLMQELKTGGLIPGSAEAATFGKLHGISSILYMLTSVAGLALILAPPWYSNPKVTPV